MNGWEYLEQFKDKQTDGQNQKFNIEKCTVLNFLNFFCNLNLVEYGRTRRLAHTYIHARTL